MLQFIAKIFGTKSDKDIKSIMPLVEQTKAEGEKLKSISNDELRGKTLDLQNVINTSLKNIDGQLHALHQQIADEPDLDLNEKESIFARIDALESDRNKELEKILMKIL